MLSVQRFIFYYWPLSSPHRSDHPFLPNFPFYAQAPRHGTWSLRQLRMFCSVRRSLPSCPGKLSRLNPKSLTLLWRIRSSHSPSQVRPQQPQYISKDNKNRWCLKHFWSKVNLHDAFCCMLIVTHWREIWQNDEAKCDLLVIVFYASFLVTSLPWGIRFPCLVFLSHPRSFGLKDGPLRIRKNLTVQTDLCIYILFL